MSESAEDVAALRKVCDDAERWAASRLWDDRNYDAIERVRALADRLSAPFPGEDLLLRLARTIDHYGAAMIAREYSAGSVFMRDLVESARAAIAAATAPPE